MALSDILVPLTAKTIGPKSGDLPREGRTRVYYLKMANFDRMEPDLDSGGSVLFVLGPNKKIELVESPNELQAALAMAQGATASAYVASNYGTLTATSSATAADLATPTKYFTEVNAGNGLTVRLPDPFVKRNFVLQNTTTGSVSVLGRGTTSAIDGSTAAYTLRAGKRIHFVAPTAATAGTTAGWRTSRDA